MNKHTPGPWATFYDHPNPTAAKSIAYIDRANVNREDGTKGLEIATVYGCERDLEQAANARLIALAPEMFDLLKDASNQLLSDGTSPKLLAEIDSLIAKATAGEK